MRRSGPRDAAESADEAVETVARLASLLTGGVDPARAWAYVAATGGTCAAAAAAAAAERGEDVSTALAAAGETWAGVAAIWTVATETGAPLADTLRDAVLALRDTAEVTGDVAVALAEPAATARLLGWLPLLGPPMGVALGADPLGILFSDPVGVSCLATGVLLMIAARLWTRGLGRRARPAAGIPGLEAELWAVALSAGVSAERAAGLIGPITGYAVDATATAAVERTLELATRAGVPAVELLRGDAWMARHRARTAGRAAAATLSTRLLLPLAMCTLPAFLLLAVVPLILGILRSNAFP